MRLIKLVGALAIAASTGVLPAAAADGEGMKISFVINGAVSNTFWQAVKNGMDDACALYKSDCSLIFDQTDGDVQGLLNNLQTAIVGRPDGIFVSIPDKTLRQPIADAISKGIVVLAVNNDDPDGAKANARLAFIGQNAFLGGYALAKAVSGSFPETGPIEVLIGLNDPGADWSESRAQGMEKFLGEYKAAHPDRPVTWRRLNVGMDLGIAPTRVLADFQANPGVTAYIETGWLVAGTARALRESGVPKGKYILAGFDLVPQLIDELKSGYVNYECDQQPYLQGYLPVVQLHLMKKYGLSAWDVNTGSGIVTPADADELAKYSKLNIR